MVKNSMTSPTYMQRPYHGVLVCSVVVCMLLVSVGLAALTWYTLASRHDDDKSPPTNATDATTAPLVTGYDLQEVMQALWDNDVSRIPETDYVLNLQSRTNVTTKIDMADSSLFSNMQAYPETLSTTYRAFSSLLDNYVATVRQAETSTMEQRLEVDTFLNAVVDTTVMQEAHSFLRYKGHAEESRASFKDLLYRVWFEPYPRSPRYNTTDSSGFEHVFVGEARRRKVIGFHSWLHFYLGEIDSTIDYRGYISIQEPRLLAVQFTWHGRQKRLGSFFVGTSPEFDMAVYTVCLLTRPNQLCRFQLNYFPVRIRTWDISHVPGLQIGSAYPELSTSNSLSTD